MRFLNRCTAFLRHERAPVLMSMLVPVLFGLLSVWLGQDENWDLRNYHWYNPYALFNDRLHVDMAAGNWQSYFNPAIDVPYYLLNQWLPGRAVAFVMGFVHGLNFILLLALARLVLPRDKADNRLCILLALAGMCGPSFLSQVGNTMGDNLSALFILASLCIVLRGWDRLQALSNGAAATLLLAGLVMGLGAGLKLTNASYALALCVALLAVPATFGRGIAAAFTYGCGTLAGVAISAGPWWWRMWKTFGNPLFPQFNSIFKSPLAQQVAVMDTDHLPHGALEALFWPFVFTREFARVSELPFKQAIVPLLYALALAFLARWLVDTVRGGVPAERLAPRARFLLLFGIVGYLVWLKLFSIYRYLVPIELLGPLMVWVLVPRLTGPRVGPYLAGGMLLFTSLYVYPFITWGHAGWAEKSFSAQLPPMEHPESTLVFTAHGDPPMGWVSTFVPREVRVISLGAGFPESPAYLERIQSVIASRPGPHYAMLAADPGEQAAKDEAVVKAATQNLARYGLTLDPAGCKRYPAAIGTSPSPVQMCPVTVNR